jgi:hypothetical protein
MTTISHNLESSSSAAVCTGFIYPDVTAYPGISETIMRSQGEKCEVD